MQAREAELPGGALGRREPPSSFLLLPPPPPPMRPSSFSARAGGSENLKRPATASAEVVRRREAVARSAHVSRKRDSARRRVRQRRPVRVILQGPESVHVHQHYRDASRLCQGIRHQDQVYVPRLYYARRGNNEEARRGSE